MFKLSTSVYFEKDMKNIDNSNKILKILFNKIDLLSSWKIEWKKLSWVKNCYRIRIWSYRLIYNIDWEYIKLLSFKNRKDVYIYFNKIIKKHI